VNRFHCLIHRSCLVINCLVVHARTPQARHGRLIGTAWRGSSKAGRDEHGFRPGGIMAITMEAPVLTEEHNGALWFNWVNSDSSSAMNRLGWDRMD
jgi:hypothetical protein